MIKVAIVHDWLTVYAGAERVLEQILILFPGADLYSICDFVAPEDRSFLHGRTPRTTFIQHLPGAKRHYRQYLPLMPLAIEQLDLSGYDLVISSSHAVAKGVLTGPDQWHVSYVYTPMRYAWDLQHQYLRESKLDRGLKGWLARYMLHRLRIWDMRTAPGVDHVVASSAYIARRINKVYGRASTVITPPVDVAAFTMQTRKDAFYVTASRLVPYKRVDLIAQAFAAMPSRRLVIIGDGPERGKIEAIARGCPNIEMTGHASTEVMRDLMQRARAFVFAAEEDFGIAPLEAQACGTPVIALARGGALETVRDGTDGSEPTGVFFGTQDVGAIQDAVDTFERLDGSIRAQACRTNAERFSAATFRAAFSALIDRDMARFKGCRAPLPAATEAP